MRLIGIPLRKPSFGEVTASAVMGVGLWLAALGLMRVADVSFDRADAGALLLVVVWGCIGARLGIHVNKGQRHLAANLIVSAALLAVYQAAWSFAG